MPSRTMRSPWRSDAPRVVAGPSVGSTARRARTKAARSRAACTGSSSPSSVAIAPGQPLRRRPTGTGTPRSARPPRPGSGTRQRQVRREHREPALLLGHVVHRPVDARQPRDQVVAEPVHGVVGAGARHAGDREVGPLRVLGRAAGGGRGRRRSSTSSTCICTGSSARTGRSHRHTGTPSSCSSPTCRKPAPLEHPRRRRRLAQRVGDDRVQPGRARLGEQHRDRAARDPAVPAGRRHRVAELGHAVDGRALPPAVADQRAAVVGVEEEVDAPRRVVAGVEALEAVADDAGELRHPPRLHRDAGERGERLVGLGQRLEPRPLRRHHAEVRHQNASARSSAKSASPSHGTPLRVNQVVIVITSWWSRSKPCGFWRRSTACGKSIIQSRSRHHSRL